MSYSRSDHTNIYTLTVLRRHYVCHELQDRVHTFSPLRRRHGVVIGEQ